LTLITDSTHDNVKTSSKKHSESANLHHGICNPNLTLTQRDPDHQQNPISSC